MLDIIDPHRMQLFASFVMKQHSGQKRRDGSDYYGHCLNVAKMSYQIALEAGHSMDMMTQCYAAGLGHDLYEDTRTDFDDVAALTTVYVAELISCVSDDKRMSSGDRHRAYLRTLEDAPTLARIVKLADLFDNVTDSLKLLKQSPESMRSFLIRWHTRAAEILNVLALNNQPAHALVSHNLNVLKSGLDI